MDCPDVPDETIDEALAAISENSAIDVAVGPTHDGGYWTLAAHAYHPQAVQSIEWGSHQVFDQTLDRIKESKLSYRVLPRWQDIDLPEISLRYEVDLRHWIN